MPIPILATAVTSGGILGKVGRGFKKIGGAIKGLFGGRKSKLDRWAKRVKRLQSKGLRLENSADRIFIQKLEKLEARAQIGEAKAMKQLARLKKKLARKGVDPNLAFDIPSTVQNRRGPQEFQQSTVNAVLEGVVNSRIKGRKNGMPVSNVSFGGTDTPDSGGIVGWIKENPIQAIGIGGGSLWLLKKLKII